MKATELNIKGAYLIELDVYGDERGFFLESYQRQKYQDFGLGVDFVQDNRSSSTKGVLRGLHYQINKPIGHLVYVTHGEIFDVGVDLRPQSPTFGKYVSATLSAENNQQLYLPPGVAHGFVTLADNNEILYKCTEYYYPDEEAGLNWADRQIAIQWPVSDPFINERDKSFPFLKGIPLSKLPKTDT